MLFPRIRFRRTAQIKIGALIVLAIGIFASPLVSPQQKQSAPEEEKKDTARRRIEWFYNQRAYPLGHIPGGARLKALRQLDEMLVREGKLVRNPDGTVAAPALAEVAAAATAGSAWTPIGPQPTNSISFGPTAGRVTALAVDPTNANIVYLGAAQGGIWKTTDSGITWTPLSDGQPSLAIGSIAIDPSSCNPAPPAVGCQTIYVGTGEENFSVDSYYGAGILKSTDGGNTWTQLGASIFVGPFSGGFAPGGGARIAALAVSPGLGPNGNPIILAAVQIFVVLNGGSSSGIYRSIDGGVTWTQVKGGAAGTDVVFDPTPCSMPCSAAVAYAALGTVDGDLDNGVYKSTDGGATWKLVGSSLPSSTSVGRISLSNIPTATPSTLYASIQDPATATFGFLLGLFKTTDGGNTWAKLTNVPDFCREQCWYDNVVRVDPTDPATIFAGGSATGDPVTGALRPLIRSTDGGNSWQNVSSGGGATLHVDQHALAFSSDGTRLYVGNDGGAYRTDPLTPPTAGSISWNDLNAALNITQFYGGASIHPSSQSIGFGGTQDNGTQKFTGPSQVWNEVACGDGGWTAIDPAIPSTVYAACSDIDIRKSFQNGDSGTFNPSDSGIDQGDRSAFIPPMVIDPATPQRLYFGTFRVYQTTNGGGSWAAVSNDLTGTGTGPGGPSVSTIVVAPSNSNVVYAGTENGHVAVCLTGPSPSALACWQDVSTGLPNRAVTQIAVDPNNPQTAYATFSGFGGCSSCDGKGHVFKTTNGGAVWTDISHAPFSVTPLPDTPVNDIVVDPDDAMHNTLFVATDIGVFQTTDGGVNWSPMSVASPGVLGLPRVAVLSLRLREPSRTLRAATHGRGMWDFQLGGVPSFSLTSISPTSTSAGTSPSFLLTVNGNGFTQSPVSTVKWNGAAQPTTFVSANELTANIPANLLTSAATAQVTVDQSGGGPISNVLVFTVTGPAPILSTVSPASVPAGSANTTITLSGSNFASNAQVFWNDSPSGVTTNPGGTSTQLTAVLSSNLLAFGGMNRVTVVNPPPGGGVSGPQTFTVTQTNPPPNDNFDNAINVAGSSFSDTEDSSSATTETTDPTLPSSCFTDTTGLASNGRANSIWYRFTPSSTVSVTADTVGSAYDTILSVWTGTKGSLTSVTCNDDIIPGIVQQSRVIFTANQGTTYFFMITAFSGDGGKSVFNLTTSAAAADFSLTANPLSATTSPGGSATYTITVTPQGGFTGTVTLACTNVPAAITCGSFSPASVMLSGVAPGTSTVTLTASANAVVPPVPLGWQGPRLLPTAWLLVVLLALAGAARLRRRRLAVELPLVLLFLLLLFKVAGCGGGGGGGSGVPSPRTFTVTVTGTAGSTSRTTTLTLVVQ